MRSHVVKGDLVPRHHRLGLENRRLTAVGRVLPASRYADVDLGVVPGDWVLDRAEPILDPVSDLDRARPPRYVKVDRDNRGLFDRGDNGGNKLEPTSARLAREDLTERVELLLRGRWIKVRLHRAVPLVQRSRPVIGDCPLHAIQGDVVELAAGAS